MTALLGIWYAFTNFGGYLSNQFPASPVEQVGNAFTAAGNAALSAFLVFLLVALIVVGVILLIRERVKPTY